MNKKTISTVIITLLVALGLTAFSKSYLLENTLSTPQKIVINTVEEYDDGMSINGKTIHEIDKNNNIIYTHTDGDLGGVSIYYKINGNSVDVYSKVNTDKKFLVDKNINIDETPVNSILNLSKLNDTVEKRKIEKKNNSFNNTKKLSDMNNYERDLFITNIENSIDKVNEFEKETENIKLTMDSSHKIEKATIDKTEFAKLIHYLNKDIEEALPVKLVHKLTYDYNTKVNLSIPLN